MPPRQAEGLFENRVTGVAWPACDLGALGVRFARTRLAKKFSRMCKDQVGGRFGHSLACDGRRGQRLGSRGAAAPLGVTASAGRQGEFTR